MNYWIVIASPDKWFCESCEKNAKVNEVLLNLENQSWRVRQDYFQDAKMGDKVVIKISQDKRSIERRTLDNGEVVDVLQSGIYAIGEIAQELYFDEEDNCHRVDVKITNNLFKDNHIIDAQMAEKILGSDFTSQSSKPIDEDKFYKVFSYIEDEEQSDIDDDEEIDSDVSTTEEVYPASINVTKDDSSVYELKRQYEKKDKRLQLSPSYQRGNVWNTKQKSELIESILMGIPLPIMYFFQDSIGVKQVVDGKQRLTALFEFMDDKFALSELNILKDLKGKKFSDLNGLEQGKIEDYKIPINVIKPPTPDRIKFDIFDRVNRGGTRLNNQEMRNAIYQGRATELLEVLKNNQDFKKATDNSIRSKVMKDRYIILRFIAFYLWRGKKLLDRDGSLVDYKSDIDAFLGKTMEFLNYTDEETIEDVKSAFERAMSNALFVFGQNGFRVSYHLNKKHKTPVNMALFDSLSYLFSNRKIEKKHKETIEELIQELFNSKEFNTAITAPADSSTKVTNRFEKMDKILEKLK